MLRLENVHAAYGPIDVLFDGVNVCTRVPFR